MRQFTTDHLASWLAPQEPPCISLYQPTHRRFPDHLQDPIRFRNLLRTLETRLGESYPDADVSSRLAPFEALAGDVEFWKRRTDGLVILASPTSFELLELQRPVAELLVVADSFHIKPLMRVLQSADRFQILSLNRQEAKLYEGNRDSLAEVTLTNVPFTIDAALGAEHTEPYSTVSTHGGTRGGDSGHGVSAVHHGHGTRKDDTELDVTKFFRVIDRAILEQYSRPSGLPLILAALPEYHAPFREVSHNPQLIADGIAFNADALDLDQLRAEAWRLMEPMYLARLGSLVDEFEVARAHEKGSDDLWQVAEAAAAGRVATLLVEADRVIPGRMDDTGRVMQTSDLDSAVDDVLDDLAEAVMLRRGDVVIVPADRMPSRTGLAATYRY